MSFNALNQGAYGDASKATSRDAVNAEQQTRIAKAKLLTPDLTKLSGKQIAALRLSDEVVSKFSDKERFIYQAIQGYEKILNERVDFWKQGFNTNANVELDFKNADLRGLEVSQLVEFLKTRSLDVDLGDGSMFYSIPDYEYLVSEQTFDMARFLQYAKGGFLPSIMTHHLAINLENARLEGSDLTNFSFGFGCNFKRANFNDANLTKTKFGTVCYDERDEDFNSQFDSFEVGRFTDAKFNRALLKDTDLYSLDLRGVSFIGAKIHTTHTDATRFAGANFFAADFPYCNSTRIACELVEARNAGLTTSFIPENPSADFTGANFAFAKVSHGLAHCNLKDAKMFGCRPTWYDDNKEPGWQADYVEGAKEGDDPIELYKKRLLNHGADLDTKVQDLSNMDLRGVDLSKVDFSNCNLQKLDARGTDFTGAKLDHSSILGMKIDAKTKITEAQIDSSLEGRRFNTTSQGKAKLSRKVFADLEIVANQGIQVL